MIRCPHICCIKANEKNEKNRYDLRQTVKEGTVNMLLIKTQGLVSRIVGKKPQNNWVVDTFD
jgi:hypothetical protein